MELATDGEAVDREGFLSWLLDSLPRHSTARRSLDRLPDPLTLLDAHGFFIDRQPFPPSLSLAQALAWGAGRSVDAKLDELQGAVDKTGKLVAGFLSYDQWPGLRSWALDASRIGFKNRMSFAFIPLRTSGPGAHRQ